MLSDITVSFSIAMRCSLSFSIKVSTDCLRSVKYCFTFFTAPNIFTPSAIIAAIAPATLPSSRIVLTSSLFSKPHTP